MPANNRSAFLSKLSLDQIQEGLQQAFPSRMFELGQLKLLNEGFNSYVVLAADEFILRIAKHANAMAGHMKEGAVLPVLQKHLPVQVPRPNWQGEPSDFFPFGVIGYRRIPGIPFSLSRVHHVELNRIAQDLARFLVALHNVPLDEMIALGLGATGEFESLQSAVMPTLHMYLTEEEYRKIGMWWERYLHDRTRNRFTPRLVHGDLWGENIILNETLNGVVGVVDFEATSIGDVAQDFAAQKYPGPDFFGQVVKHYRALGGELEDQFADRVQAWSMQRELSGLQYAIRYPESGELMDSLHKVRHELSLSI